MLRQRARFAFTRTRTHTHARTHAHTLTHSHTQFSCHESMSCVLCLYVFARACALAFVCIYYVRVCVCMCARARVCVCMYVCVCVRVCDRRIVHVSITYQLCTLPGGGERRGAGAGFSTSAWLAGVAVTVDRPYCHLAPFWGWAVTVGRPSCHLALFRWGVGLSLIHISEPTRPP